MSKRKNILRMMERIKARDSKATVNAESSVLKRVLNAIRLCGGRASASRVLDTVNKDRGRILSYNEVKGMKKYPFLIKTIQSVFLSMN